MEIFTRSSLIRGVLMTSLFYLHVTRVDCYPTTQQSRFTVDKVPVDSRAEQREDPDQLPTNITTKGPESSEKTEAPSKAKASWKKWDLNDRSQRNRTTQNGKSAKNIAMWQKWTLNSRQNHGNGKQGAFKGCAGKSKDGQTEAPQGTTPESKWSKWNLGSKQNVKETHQRPEARKGHLRNQWKKWNLRSDE
ncbi:uncharacterized protein LOC122256958 [Penaeus japonicus]|uniref:uncharacterized protein LOC122256958 n=1 Tax=Penaeus japonicus TaxID=27405 RepID=UPI001C713CCD|nr:uncharacterized protein LOC122256958 [Penaeus japonicus]